MRVVSFIYTVIGHTCLRVCDGICFYHGINNKFDMDIFVERRYNNL